MARAQAKQIFREKYRYCEWDKNHPEVDVEKEIIDNLVSFILAEAGRLREWEANKPQKFLSSGVYLGDKLIEEFIYGDRDKALQRINELTAQNGGKYDLREIER